MKTDRVLTMDEYLDACWVAPHSVNPPPGDARHVPITTQEDVNPRIEVHGCRCDRWGHPCSGCAEKRNNFPLAKK